MSTRITQRTRTNEWHSSVAASSAAAFSTRTDDPSLSITMVPMLTVVLAFGGQSGLQSVSTRPVLPQRWPEPPRIENTSPNLADAERVTDLPAASGAPEAERNESEVTPDSNAPRPRAERRLRLLDPPAAPAAPAMATEPEAAKPPHPNRLEMTIDSLPHHDLIEPIPIAIDPLGDTVFTASVNNLDVSATGNSVGEALVLLKEQIEFVYGDLNRRSNLSADEKTMLQMLHTYIAPRGNKPEWL